ncbi:hypothetical protein CV102_24405 [Natronococcus pandeyae]|uniref:Uncharacterized protein n=1 Tax=Natronococcus pandeyae TaxID=2055836 RepID=A0A8J8TQ22_9EURY|nr:hypothetical protein [Natronococcus pandeyae]TYL36082.1 hypothetical protein CV102_24405 [Natronococcus pandeyae]
MTAVAEPIKEMRRLSRRAVAGLLASGSVLASRPMADLLAIASDLFDISVSLFFVYETLGGGNVLASIVLTFVLFGYLVYAYTPDLYSKQFGDIVEARSFRALTAVITLYFCLVFGRITGFVPDVGPFVYLPEMVGAVLAAVLVGFLISTIVFSGYILLIRGERVLSKSGEPFETYDAFFIQPLQENLEKIETLPNRRRNLVIAINESAAGGLYVVSAAFLGVALALVGLLSPIPEVIVVGAVLGSYFPLGGRLSGALPDRVDSDIEFRIADNVTDAFQNFKGCVLVLFCILGIGFSGIFLVGGISILSVAGRAFVELCTGIIGTPGAVDELALSELGVIAARLWFMIGIVTSLITYSLYSLLYWFRQLQRLPAYVTFWEAYWQSESSSPPTPSVTRPPGLFLPGNALLLGLGAVVWLAPDLDTWTLWVGWGVVWPVLIGIVLWSARADSCRSSQSLRGEGRDVLVALGLQVTSFGIVVVATGGSPGAEMWLGALLVLVGIAYFPEIFVYTQRQQGAATYLAWLYIVGLSAVVLFAIESVASVPLIVYFVVAGLLLMLLLVKIIESSHTSPSADE